MPFCQGGYIKKSQKKYIFLTFWCKISGNCRGIVQIIRCGDNHRFGELRQLCGFFPAAETPVRRNLITVSQGVAVIIPRFCDCSYPDTVRVFFRNADIIPAAGGGGYLIMISDEPVEHALKIIPAAI